MVRFRMPKSTMIMADLTSPEEVQKFVDMEGEPVDTSDQYEYGPFLDTLKDFFTDKMDRLSNPSSAFAFDTTGENNYLRNLDLMKRQEDFQDRSNAAAMNFSAEQAKISRDWSEMMSSTAYQRAVKDMQLAGLNPALAYTQGPSSTPSAASASGVSSAGASGSLSDTGYKDEELFTSLMSTLITAAALIYGKKK